MAQAKNMEEAFTSFLSDADPGDLPMIIAILERIAAEYYRGWIADTNDPVEQAGLRACADTEDMIAEFIESLELNPQSKIDQLNQRFPNMRKAYDELMASRSRNDQFRIQAEGEMGGADLMNQFAAETTGAASARYSALALYEESNSVFLRSLIGAVA